MQLYTFDYQLQNITPVSAPLDQPPIGPAPSSAAPLVAAVESLLPQGSPTALSTSLRSLLDEYRGNSLAAVVVLTDGIASAGDDERLSRVATLAQERGVPLYTIGVGSRDPARDLELFDLLAEEVVSLGEPLTLAFRQRAFGLAGQTTEVRVTAAGRPRR